MRSSVVLMFSGQGSQYYGMGKELFENNKKFCDSMLELDEVVKGLAGYSVLDVLYAGKGKNEEFTEVSYTHPALFMVQYSLARLLLAEGVQADYVLGASLGEYVAAALAGVMEPGDVLEVLLKQALLLETHCKPGGMLAVFAQWGFYQEAPFVKENSELAGVGFADHFVLAGEKEKLKELEQYFQEKEIITQMIPVSYGFHSFLVEPIAAEYLFFIREKKLFLPRIPIVSSLGGCEISEVRPEYFWEVTRRPFRFAKAIEYLQKRGKHIYLDLGPTGTLAGYVKRNLGEGAQSSAFPVLTPFGGELKKLREIFRLLAVGKGKRKGNIAKKEEREMIAYLFPGQGSQQKGMGGELFDEFKELTAQADEILGYSIKKLCLEDADNRLVQTNYTQPALYVVNALTYLKKIRETGKKPSYVAGHSLGEYNALFAAESFDFATGLRLVKKRGELMSKATGGGMAAVIGLSREEIEQILQEAGFTKLDVANFNSPSQIVISGAEKDITKAKPVFEKAGAAMYVVLKVSGAFHSRYMEPAQKEFAEFLQNFQFADPVIPVISNVQARPYQKGEVKKNLLEQFTASVQWTDSIRYLMGKGVEEMEQIGPGKVLTDLVKKIKKEAEPLVIQESIPLNIETKGKQEPPSAVNAQSLGDRGFKEDYGLKYAYLTGSMYKGIASPEMVVRLGKAGMMGFFGAAGLDLKKLEETIVRLQKELSKGEPYGMSLLHNPLHPELEEKIVDLYLKHGVHMIEASAYLSVSEALAKYRLQGVKRDKEGKVRPKNRIIAKLSRPEVAEIFMSPVPSGIVDKLKEKKEITPEEAEISRGIPLADDVCVEADSAGHTDRRAASVLMPAVLILREKMMRKYGYSRKIRIGAAGGIGTPEAAAAALVLGAEFLMTGSINQCTVEADISDTVKDMLEDINVQDTDYAPSVELFELGARVQVLKKGVFFPARANKLFELYRQYDSLEDLEIKTKEQLEERYFQQSLEEVWQEVAASHSRDEVEKAGQNPKQKMALVFRWYLERSSEWAWGGLVQRKVDFQVQCSPALGAFNQWVKGTSLEKWKNRHVDEIGIKLLEETARLLLMRYREIC